MIKTRKTFALTILLTVTALLLCCACCFLNNNVACAATAGENGGDAEPYGLMAKISLSIGSYGDRMWARAHNDFTLGFSTVQVYVYLYSSLEYTDDYNNMTLECYEYIGDLNINKTLEITAPINGVQRYWKARVKSKLDSKGWEEKVTSTLLIDANGDLL